MQPTPPTLTVTDPDAEPSAPTLTDDQRRDVIGWWSTGKPMAAIRLYIEATGADLETAKQAVLAMAEDQPTPEGWTPPAMEHPPLSPEEQVVFQADEGWSPDSGNLVSLPKPKRAKPKRAKPELSVAPAEPPRPPPPKVTKKEESRRFPLTDEDIAERNALLCTETLEDAKQELADKQIRAEITERRKARKARLQELAGEINNRATTRLVTVIYTIDYAAGILTETVDGTGEVLAVKPLSGPDAQVPLPLPRGGDKPAAPAADVVVDEDDGSHD